MQKFEWSRTEGYQVSSKGDKRFSAMYAELPDGRTIEQHYQCDIKGYSPGGTNWRLGKGKPPLDTSLDLFGEYVDLWRIWANINPHLMAELRSYGHLYGYTLCDYFAHTPINQAHALCIILNEDH